MVLLLVFICGTTEISALQLTRSISGERYFNGPQRLRAYTRAVSSNALEYASRGFSALSNVRQKRIFPTQVQFLLWERENHNRLLFCTNIFFLCFLALESKRSDVKFHSSNQIRKKRHFSFKNTSFHAVLYLNRGSKPEYGKIVFVASWQLPHYIFHLIAVSFFLRF